MTEEKGTDSQMPKEEAAAKDGQQPKDGQPPKKSRDGKLAVKDWTEKTGARRAIVAGAAQMHGWELETKLTEKEFKDGVKAFAEKPMGGPKKKPGYSGKVLPQQ